ncbi:MAG: segregation and condensation protein A, partial [Syntrophomonadaceae bacterium]
GHGKEAWGRFFCFLGRKQKNRPHASFPCPSSPFPQYRNVEVVMEYIVDLEAFHGPLDLLLYLVERHELDIYDIPIASITDQYMEHLHHTGAYDLDILGDFLIMASYLLNLKSKMLLPRLKNQEARDEEENIEDPREELVQKLLEYKKIKQMAEILAERQNGEYQRVFFRDTVYQTEEKEEIVASIGALTRAYQAVLVHLEPAPLTIPQGDIDVTAKMEELLERLSMFKQGIIFQDLFAGAVNKREAMAYFLALLELIRQRRVKAYQERQFANIKVFLQVAVNNVDA